MKKIGTIVSIFFLLPTLALANATSTDPVVEEEGTISGGYTFCHIFLEGWAYNENGTCIDRETNQQMRIGNYLESQGTVEQKIAGLMRQVNLLMEKLKAMVAAQSSL